MVGSGRMLCALCSRPASAAAEPEPNPQLLPLPLAPLTFRRRLLSSSCTAAALRPLAVRPRPPAAPAVPAAPSCGLLTCRRPGGSSSSGSEGGSSEVRQDPNLV